MNLLTTEGDPYPEIVPSGHWRIVLRQTAAIAGLILFALTVACGGGGNSGGGLEIATATPTAPIPATAVPEPTATPTEAETFSGFIYPIPGGCLPVGDQLMPNAPREYRQGTHEGVDFYDVDNCTDIVLGTPIVAVKAGRVIRADHDYVDLTSEQLSEISVNLTSEESLDVFRGRQVWVEHEGGIVTRYCHLSGIAEGLEEGDEVTQGQTIAFVGESGTPESISASGGQMHLHFEVRVGDSYLGAGETPAQVRAMYLELFSP